MADTTVTDLPLRNDLPWYSIVIVLSGTVYTLDFRYNARMSRWIMDIGDAVGTTILAGVPLLIDCNLIGRFTAADLPIGMLFVKDNTGEQQQPTRNSFGTTHTLWYEDPTGTT